MNPSSIIAQVEGSGTFGDVATVPPTDKSPLLVPVKTTLYVPAGSVSVASVTLAVEPTTPSGACSRFVPPIQKAKSVSEGNKVGSEAVRITPGLTNPVVVSVNV